MKTQSQKQAEIKREWWMIDASTMPLGKLAVIIADKLMGKSKVTYTPHIDNGDYVVVINAKDIVVTGLPTGAEYRFELESAAVTVAGISEDIDKLSTQTIKASVDVTGLKSGTHDVNVMLDLDAKKYTYTPVKLRIAIADSVQTATPPADSGENTQTPENFGTTEDSGIQN